MILVEKRANPLHLSLLSTIPFLLFLTRSRAGVLAYVVSWLVIVGFSLRHIRVTWMLRRRMKRMVWTCLAILIGVLVFSEMEDRTVSKLLRKTNQVEEDSRSLKQALTSSRQGLIGRCLFEFRRNPMLGSGFQVQQEHRELYRRRAISLYSAPIEKGILPLMVLGETGFVGFAVFVGFLFVFFGTCVRRRYIATATLFIVYLSTNMGEATFFAPSGGGGVMWLITLVGGFTIDMTVKHGNILFEEMRTRSLAISPIPVSPAIDDGNHCQKDSSSSMPQGIPSRGAFP
jgi:O-antigen ligase